VGVGERKMRRKEKEKMEEKKEGRKKEKKLNYLFFRNYDL
jgi:hypothetical protein